MMGEEYFCLIFSEVFGNVVKYDFFLVEIKFKEKI